MVTTSIVILIRGIRQSGVHGNHIYSYTVPTERNLTESEPRADPELTVSKRLKRTQIFTCGPSKRSRVRYCVIELSIKFVVN
jgi:hypothetical protein